MRRRTLLGAGATLLAAAGCGTGTTRDSPPSERVEYGPDASQFGDLYRPTGTPRGVVVVIHGGFWRSAYDLSLGVPLAADLVRRGWAVLNLEYRRVGGGGGNPATFDDVAAGIDALRGTGLDLTRVITLGHSAGGHLAVWAAGRLREARWAGGVPVTHAISQAGVLDLRDADAGALGDNAVRDLLGHAPGPADAALDPRLQLPLEIPVWCVHGRADVNVPFEQSVSYVDAARAAGARAELVEIDGDHFVLIDPTSSAWARTLTILDGIQRR